MARGKQQKQREDPATKAYQEGLALISSHPLFRHFTYRASTFRSDSSQCPKEAWAVVSETGIIQVHRSRHAEPAEWAYVIGHCLLHLGFGHFQEKGDPDSWQAACDVVAARFLETMKIGRRPVPGALPGGSVDSLYNTFRETGIPAEVKDLSLYGRMTFRQSLPNYKPTDFPALLAMGISTAVTSALEEVSGKSRVSSDELVNSRAQRAKSWFISSYPLLGALASVFKIIENPEICQRYDVAVGAVNATGREIYMNPVAQLDEMECRFVMAHELLHVGLRHLERQQGRDHYLWNVACDYVINDWLIEMRVGLPPQVGLLYDASLKGLSAEEVYDHIVRNLRVYRKLGTFRAIGKGDMLGEPIGRGSYSDLDDFYRRALCQGLELHRAQDRGFLPAGLEEEIRALGQPPIPWNVELAQWLDGYFRPIEQRRTYSRLSRRQSATPDIPRPRTMHSKESYRERTFGVVLDTSGSMGREELAKGLGAIASYAASRDVPYVRVIFCDVVAYDEGYMAADDIAGSVRVRGRGGTVLQPAIDLLDVAKDFPAQGPVLVITDGMCDRLVVQREHAYLMPLGRTLPFPPKGPVFRMG